MAACLLPSTFYTPVTTSCNPSVCSPPGSATLVQVIQIHAQEFLEKMNSEVIATQLETLALIPERVKNDILHSKRREDGNAHLFRHLKEDANERTAVEIFRVASEESGYGKMNDFAAFMLNELQGGWYNCMIMAQKCERVYFYAFAPSCQSHIAKATSLIHLIRDIIEKVYGQLKCLTMSLTWLNFILGLLHCLFVSVTILPYSRKLLWENIS